MSDLNREIDEWFLGKTRSVKTLDQGLPCFGNKKKKSYYKNSASTKKPLPVGVGTKNLKAAAFKHPEVYNQDTKE